MIGGAEKLWQGFYDYVRMPTPHHIELIRIPVREQNFAGLMAGYRAFAELDLSRFDQVISTKYPAWTGESSSLEPCHVSSRRENPVWQAYRSVANGAPWRHRHGRIGE